MFARSDEYFARVKFRTKSRTELASTVTSSPKVLTSPLLLTGTRPRQESFSRTTGIGIYLRRTQCIFGLFIFPPVVTQHRQRGRELVSLPFISPSHYFDPRHPSAPCRRIVTYSALFAWLVHGITSRSDFAKEHSANFDNHSKHEISFACRSYT